MKRDSWRSEQGEKKEMLRTGMNPSNWVDWTILPRRSASLPMGDLHDLHEDRPDLAYSAFQGFGGAAILPAATASALPSPPPVLGSYEVWLEEKRVRCFGMEEGSRCGRVGLVFRHCLLGLFLIFIRF